MILFSLIAAIGCGMLYSESDYCQFCQIPDEPAGIEILYGASISLMVVGLLNVPTIRRIKIVDMLYADKQNDPHIKKSRYMPVMLILYTIFLMSVLRSRIENVGQEISRMEKAVRKAESQLKGLYDKALLEVGESRAAIFDVHQMMLVDQDYQESIQNIIQTQQVNAEYAVAVTAVQPTMILAEHDKAFMENTAAKIVAL